MGACCSKGANGSGDEGVLVENSLEDRDYDVVEEDDNVTIGDFGARMRLQGASKFISMYTQQGKKGVNQDAMTVWEVITSIIPISFSISHIFFCLWELIYKFPGPDQFIFSWQFIHGSYSFPFFSPLYILHNFCEALFFLNAFTIPQGLVLLLLFAQFFLMLVLVFFLDVNINC